VGGKVNQILMLMILKNNLNKKMLNNSPDRNENPCEG
jgi:hypothetical protein